MSEEDSTLKPSDEIEESASEYIDIPFDNPQAVQKYIDSLETYDFPNLDPQEAFVSFLVIPSGRKNNGRIKVRTYHKLTMISDKAENEYMIDLSPSLDLITRIHLPFLTQAIQCIELYKRVCKTSSDGTTSQHPEVLKIYYCHGSQAAIISSPDLNTDHYYPTIDMHNHVTIADSLQGHHLIVRMKQAPNCCISPLSSKALAEGYMLQCDDRRRITDMCIARRE